MGPAPESPTKNRGRARVTEADILDNAYGIPTLSMAATTQHGRAGPSGSGSSSSKPASSHGRSMSHPFPSLFHSKKKGTAPAPPEVAFFDNDDDASPDKNTGARSSRVPDKDFLTGKCMTCNSSVSWPKALHAFRCKVCTTVNDLQLYTPIPNDGRKSSGGGKVTTYSGLGKAQLPRGML